MAPHGTTKLWEIINYWLDQDPPLLVKQYPNIRYVVFDGKYVDGRRLSLLTLVDAANHKHFASRVTQGETRKAALPFFKALRAAGLQLRAVTVDGKSTISKAFQSVWPQITLQRCHFHIRSQVKAWCRANPKTKVAGDIKELVSGLKFLTNQSKAEQWRYQYAQLVKQHQATLDRLDPNHPVEGDIIRSYSLVANALPNMFCYLGDDHIKRTTNSCEGYFKKIQRGKGFDHAGLTKPRLTRYLAWKVYFDYLKDS